MPPVGLPAIRCAGLIKRYGDVVAVAGLDLTVASGECFGLLGPNGAGKTTCFYMIVGLVPADAGQIVVDGKDITGEPMYARAKYGVGYLPQEPSVFRKLTVEENLLSVFETMNLPLSERERRTNQLLEEFGITHIARSRAFTLSGGERR
ncbi:MAG: ATP-binding cassette domain-containing protein, partial [Acidimicrobiales bacterium]